MGEGSVFRAMIFARDGGICIWSGKPATDLAHLVHYGAGRRRDSGVFDVPFNACALAHDVHMSHHAGLEPTRKQLQEILAKKYGYVYEEGWEDRLRDAAYAKLKSR